MMQAPPKKIIYVCSLSPGDCMCEASERLYCVHSRQREVEKRDEDDDEE